MTDRMFLYDVGGEEVSVAQKDFKAFQMDPVFKKAVPLEAFDVGGETRTVSVADRSDFLKAYPQARRLDTLDKDGEEIEIDRGDRAKFLESLPDGEERTNLARQILPAHPYAKNTQSVGKAFVSGFGEGLVRGARDLGVTAAKSVVSVPEMATGAADLVTAPIQAAASKILTGTARTGLIGKAQESLGIDYKGAQDALGNVYSEEQKAANQAVENAQGVLGKAKEYAKHPTVAVHQTLQSLPSMAGGATIAPKLVGMGASRALAGAMGEGAVTAAQMQEQIRQGQESGMTTPLQSAAALGAGTATAALGFGSGKLAGKLGIVDPETLAAGGAKSATKNTMPLVPRVGMGALQEGVIEEAPQSVSEQMFQNVGTGRPVMEGTQNAGVSGAIVGGVMGGGTNVARGNEGTKVFPAIPDSVAPRAPVFPAPGSVIPTPAAPVVPAGSGSATLVVNPEIPANTSAYLDKNGVAPELAPAAAELTAIVPSVQPGAVVKAAGKDWEFSGVTDAGKAQFFSAMGDVVEVPVPPPAVAANEGTKGTEVTQAEVPVVQDNGPVVPEAMAEKPAGKVAKSGAVETVPQAVNEGTQGTQGTKAAASFVDNRAGVLAQEEEDAAEVERLKAHGFGAVDEGGVVPAEAKNEGTKVTEGTKAAETAPQVDGETDLSNDAERERVEAAIARGEKVPMDVLERFPWLAADEVIKPYVEGLINLSDKQLKAEEKRAAKELNDFANNTPTFTPDRKLNPAALGTRAYFEISNKFDAINREIRARQSRAPQANGNESVPAPVVPDGMVNKPAGKVAKEPWEMTKAEYGNQAAKRVSGQSAGKSRKMAHTYHAIQVINAVKEGKPVPDEVLSDYPELAKAAPAQGGTVKTVPQVDTASAPVVPEAMAEKPAGKVAKKKTVKARGGAVETVPQAVNEGTQGTKAAASVGEAPFVDNRAGVLAQEEEDAAEVERLKAHGFGAVDEGGVAPADGGTVETVPERAGIGRGNEVPKMFNRIEKEPGAFLTDEQADSLTQEELSRVTPREYDEQDALPEYFSGKSDAEMMKIYEILKTPPPFRAPAIYNYGFRHPAIAHAPDSVVLSLKHYGGTREIRVDAEKELYKRGLVPNDSFGEFYTRGPSDYHILTGRNWTPAGGAVETVPQAAETGISEQDAATASMIGRSREMVSEIDAKVKAAKFKKGKATVKLADNKTAEETGLVYKHLMVHQGPSGWKITHIPSGLAIQIEGDQKDARVAAVRLAEIIPEDVSSWNSQDSRKAAAMITRDAYADVSALLGSQEAGGAVETPPPSASGEAGFVNLGAMLPDQNRVNRVVRRIKRALDPNRGVGAGAYSAKVDMDRMLESARIGGKEAKLRLNGIMKSLEGAFGREAVGNALVAVQDGKMTPAEWSEKFGLAPGNESERLLDSMLKLTSENSKRIMEWTKRGGDAEAAQEMSFYQTRAYLLHALGEDYMPKAAARAAAVVELRAGFEEAVERVVKGASAVATDLRKPAGKRVVLDAVGYLKTGDEDLLAGASATRAASARALRKQWLEIQGIVDELAMEGDEVTAQINAEAATRAAESFIDFYLHRGAERGEARGAGVEVGNMRKRFLEGAFRELYGEIVDPAERQRITTEVQGRMIAEMAFFERVVAESQGSLWDTMPNTEKGITERLGEAGNPTDRKRFGEMAGRYVTPDLKALIEGSANSGAVHAAMNKLYFGPMAFQRMVKLLAPKTVSRNYITALTGLALETGDVFLPGYWESFGEAHKIAVGYARGNPDAVAKVRKLVEIGVFNPGEGSWTADMRAAAGGAGGKLQKLGKSVASGYSFLDFPTKYAAFMARRASGMTEAEAAQHVQKMYQNRTRTPEIVGLASRVGLADYLSYTYDSVRMQANSLAFAVKQAREGKVLPMVGWVSARSIWLMASTQAAGAFSQAAGRLYSELRKLLRPDDEDGDEVKNLSSVQLSAMRDMVKGYDRNAPLLAWREESGGKLLRVGYAVAGGQTAFPLDDAFAGALQSRAHGESFLDSVGSTIGGMAEAGMYVNTWAKAIGGSTMDGQRTPTGKGLWHVMAGQESPDRAQIIQDAVLGWVSDMSPVYPAKMFTELLARDRNKDAGVENSGIFARTEPTTAEIVTRNHRLVRSYTLGRTDMNAAVRDAIRPTKEGLERATMIMSNVAGRRIEKGAVLPKHEQQEAVAAKAYERYIRTIADKVKSASEVAPEWFDANSTFMVLRASGLSKMEAMQAVYVSQGKPIEIKYVPQITPDYLNTSAYQEWAKKQ